MNDSGQGLRVAVVGFGSLAQSHLLPAIRATDRFRVTAIADPRRDAAREVHRLDPGIRHVDDFRRLDASHFDVAVVAVPNHLHAEVASHFLARGVDVFCEKPLAVSVADCRTLIELAQRHGRRLMVGHVLRFAPAARFARELVRAGLLGAFRYLSLSQGTDRPIRSVSGFYARRQECGGGVLMDKAIHLFDLFEFLLGEIEIARARLVATDGLGPGLEDEVAIELRAAGSAQPSVYVVSRVRKLDGRLTMVFEHGNLHLDLKDPSRLSLAWQYMGPERRDSARIGLSRVDLFAEEMRHLAAVVADAAPCEADGATGLRAVAHVEEVYRLLGIQAIR